MEVINKKAILFDKDGTLIKYNDLWIDSIFAMVIELDEKYHRKFPFDEHQLYRQLGILETHVSDDSPLGTGTTAQITAVFQKYFIATEIEMLKFVQDYLYQYTVNHQEDLIPIGDLPNLLKSLKKENYSLGIVTSDDFDSTIFTLKLFEIDTYFDVVVTGDKFAPKPEKEALEYASKKMRISPDNILFVGDSSIDAKFARHCRLGVGVTSGVANRDELVNFTPYIYDTIHDIPYQKLFSVKLDVG